jgi:hypothetical protein
VLDERVQPSCTLIFAPLVVPSKEMLRKVMFVSQTSHSEPMLAPCPVPKRQFSTSVLLACAAMLSSPVLK